MKFSRVIASVGLLGVATADSNEVAQCLTEPSPTPAAATTSFTRFFDQDQFRALFPDAVELYNFEGLVNAASAYPAFANTGNDDNDRRELAAFLAQTAHESDRFKAAEEYAKNTYSVWQYCDNSTYSCAFGCRYHGRGPIQLSWNYNYYNAGKALGIDLLNNPDIVASDTVVAWRTALWYWMTPQSAGRIIHDVVTGEHGFAQSTDIINGGLECGLDAPNQKSEKQRIAYFALVCEVLGVQPLGNSSCNA